MLQMLRPCIVYEPWRAGVLALRRARCAYLRCAYSTNLECLGAISLGLSANILASSTAELPCTNRDD